MLKIGIDFSLTSPGICINMQDEYHFISLFDTSSVKDWEKSNKFETHRNLSTIIQTIPYRRITQEGDYNLSEGLKMTNARILAERIVIILSDIVKGDDVTIGIEGFSFGSKSSSYIDLVMYQTILRVRLIEEFGEVLVVLSPSHIKKSFTGKGNANKELMIKSFIESDDEKILKNNFHKYIKEIYKDSIVVDKPIDDLVDSFAILKCL